MKHKMKEFWIALSSYECYYLQDVVSWLDICNINPLAVNVCTVCVIATWTETLEEHLKTRIKKERWLQHTLQQLDISIQFSVIYLYSAFENRFCHKAALKYPDVGLLS